MKDKIGLQIQFYPRPFDPPKLPKSRKLRAGEFYVVLRIITAGLEGADLVIIFRIQDDPCLNACCGVIVGPSSGVVLYLELYVKKVGLLLLTYPIRPVTEFKSLAFRILAVIGTLDSGKAHRPPKILQPGTRGQTPVLIEVIGISDPDPKPGLHLAFLLKHLVVQFYERTLQVKGELIFGLPEGTATHL